MKLKNRPTTDPTIEALRHEVHGDKLSTCGACGTRRPRDPSTMHVAEALGKGRVFHRCTECVMQGGRLASHAAALVLDMDAADPALKNVQVESFERLPHSDPARPNTTPWAHLNVAALAETIERARHEIARRTGGPCFFCGLAVTVEGTGWHRENDKQVCGCCRDRFRTDDGLTYKDEDRRSRAAVVLCGLNRGIGIPLLEGFGADVGVVWWGESGKGTPNRWPFQHLDFTELRDRARHELTRQCRRDLVARVDRVRGVTVRW